MRSHRERLHQRERQLITGFSYISANFFISAAFCVELRLRGALRARLVELVRLVLATKCTARRNVVDPPTSHVAELERARSSEPTANARPNRTEPPATLSRYERIPKKISRKPASMTHSR